MSNEQQIVIVWNIKVLEPRLVSMGPIVLKCYINNPVLEKIEEKKLTIKENLFESISKEVLKVKKEISKKIKPNSIVLIEVSGKGFAYKHGGKIEDTGEERLLFPAPSKLVKIGLHKDGKIHWIKPKKEEELYVYEGIVDIPKEIDFVIIDTENGSHILTVESATKSEEKVEETTSSE